MNIALVIDSLARGGAERQALNTTWELSRRGYDVELIYYYDVEPAYDHPALHHAKVTCLPKKWGSIGLIWRLRGCLRRGGFDVVQAFKGGACVNGCLAAWLAGTPVVLASYRNAYCDHGTMRLAHRVVDRLVTGWVVNARASIDTILQAIGGRREKFFVVPNGIDPKAFESPLTPGQARKKLGLEPAVHTVSIVASLTAQKNHELFLEMAPRVLERHTRTRFLIVGNGALRPMLERRTRALGIADAVMFLGDRSDVPDILAATDVFVLSSHYEGCPNALVEAMGAGIPVVSTDWRGVEDVMTHGREGLVVPLGDVESMAETVGRLLTDPELRRRLGEQGQQTVRTRFSPDAMIEALLALYRRCLREAGVPTSERPQTQLPRTGESAR